VISDGILAQDTGGASDRVAILNLGRLIGAERDLDESIAYQPFGANCGNRIFLDHVSRPFF
jgi:hypothetical protein